MINIIKLLRFFFFGNYCFIRQNINIAGSHDGRIVVRMLAWRAAIEHYFSPTRTRCAIQRPLKIWSECYSIKVLSRVLEYNKSDSNPNFPTFRSFAGDLEFKFQTRGETLYFILPLIVIIQPPFMYYVMQ